MGLKRRRVLTMIVLTVVTFGFYYPIWFLRRRAALNQLDSPTKLHKWPLVLQLAVFVGMFILGFAAAPGSVDQLIGEGPALVVSLAQLGVCILILVQCFRIKDILEDHLAGPDDSAPAPLLSVPVQLSSMMTFFFTIFYLQHVINRDIVAVPADVA